MYTLRTVSATGVCPPQHPLQRFDEVVAYRVHDPGEMVFSLYIHIHEYTGVTVPHSLGHTFVTSTRTIPQGSSAT